jgi:flagellin-like protein
MKARRGISPVIATVIIVAVAIAISIAVAGWLMGLWGGFGQTESLKVFPDSYADAGTDKFYIIVQNTGGSPAQIYRIDIAGNNFTTFDVDNNLDGKADKTGQTSVTVNPGEKLAIIVDVSSTIDVASGVAYTVTIYTEAGNVYTSIVYGK